jgi:hypothetical protein
MLAAPCTECTITTHPDSFGAGVKGGGGFSEGKVAQNEPDH